MLLIKEHQKIDFVTYTEEIVSQQQTFSQDFSELITVTLTVKLKTEL